MRTCLVIGLGLLALAMIAPVPTYGATGFAVGNRFTLDTRKPSTPTSGGSISFAVGNRFTLDTRQRGGGSGFAVGPRFELSTLRITGRILDRETGVPLGSTTILAVAGVETRSGTDGGFVLVGVKPGVRYTLTVGAPGYGVEMVEAITVAVGRSVTGLEIRLRRGEGRYTVVPLWPPEDEVSSVMQGGTAVRYVQVQDLTGRPGPPGVGVSTTVSALDVVSDASGVVAVPIPWSQVGSGRPGDRRMMQITGVGGRALTPPLTFTVAVRPRTYAMRWESEGYSRVGISFITVATGGGTAISLEETDGNLGAFNELEIGREVRSGVGAEAKVGVSAGVTMTGVAGTKVGVGAGVEAGVEGMLSTVSEDRYRFAYPDRTAAQAMAQYVLVADGMVGALSPALVNLLSFIEGRFAGQSTLEDAYVYGGRGLDVMVGAEASADAMAGVFGRQVRAGIGVEAGVGAKGHGTLTWAEYPREDKSSVTVGVTGEGGAGARAEAGFVVDAGSSEWGAAAFGGVEREGQIGGQIEVVFRDGQVRRVEITTGKRGRWGYDIGVEFLRGDTEGRGQGWIVGRTVETSTTLIVEGGGDVLQAVLASDPLGQAVVERRVSNLTVGGAMFQRLLTSIATAAQQLRQTGRPPSISYVKEVHQVDQEEGGEIDLQATVGTSALRVAVAAGKTIDRQKGLVAEQGVWVAGAFRPLEIYTDDAFTPGTDRTMASLIQEIHDGMGDIVTEAFGYIAERVKEGVETVVTIGKSTLKVAAGSVSQGVKEIGAVVWSWWGPSPSASPLTLPSAEYGVRAKIATVAQQAARLDYGIGGFYQLMPQGEVLLSPAELTIAYQDEEVTGIDEGTLAVYTYDQATGEWLLVGGTVDAATNTVTARISVLGVYTLAPRIPSGSFGLIPEGTTVPADGVSTVAVVSDTIRNNDGTVVADGTLVTVSSTSGTVEAEDADPTQAGLQVASQGGRVRFRVRAGEVALPAEVTARSVVGKASGQTTVTLTDATPPVAPTGVSAAWDGRAVVVHWRANPEADLAGYRIHYEEGHPGPPYTGTAAPPGRPSPITVGTDTTARVVGLQPGVMYYVVLSAYDLLGNESGYSPEVTVQAGVTAVPEETGPVLPGNYRLWPNAPNPFNAQTLIRYTLPRRGWGDLTVYDLLGRRVRTLVVGEVTAGTHTAIWDGRDGRGKSVASGVYFYVLRAEQVRQVRRMVLVR